MSEKVMYALMDWKVKGDDGTLVSEEKASVINMTAITMPRKSFSDYKVKDLVTAKFSGSPYFAEILQISDNRTYLNQVLAGKVVPPSKTMKVVPPSKTMKVVPPSKTMKVVPPRPSVATKEGKSPAKESSMCTPNPLREQIIPKSKPVLVRCLSNEENTHMKFTGQSTGKEITPVASSSTKRVNEFQDPFILVPVPRTPKRSYDVALKSPTLTQRLSQDQTNDSDDATDSDKLDHQSKKSDVSERYVSVKQLRSILTETCVFTQEYNDLVDEVQSLRRRIRKLEKIPAPTTSGTTTSNIAGHPREELLSLVQGCMSEFEAVNLLLFKLFGREYILSHSVSGKRANSRQHSKPHFDKELFGEMVSLLRTKFPELSRTAITQKVHSVQKKARREQNGNA